MKFAFAFIIALALSGALNIQASPVKSSSQLQDDLNDFLSLLPDENITEILYNYINDPQIQTVIKYVQSDGFKELVKKVESIPEVINFYDYLDEAGLDIYGTVNRLHEAIGLPPLLPGKPSGNVRATGGIAGLIKEIKAVLPLKEIKALYEKKLKTSAAFAKLVERLHSPKLQQLVDALRANAEFKKILQFCYDAGVDVGAITELLASLFGLQFPHQNYAYSRNQELLEDVIEFYQLLPIDEIMKINEDYINNDEEFGELFEYLTSEQFGESLLRIESVKEVQDLLAYFQNSDMNIYESLEAIHEALELPPFQPSSSLLRRTGGIAGYVSDFKALLPVKAIKALHQEKIKNSPTFARFVERMSSPELQQLLSAVRANKEARAVLDEFKAHGLDIKAFGDLSGNILGFGL